MRHSAFVSCHSARKLSWIDSALLSEDLFRLLRIISLKCSAENLEFSKFEIYRAVMSPSEETNISEMEHIERYQKMVDNSKLSFLKNSLSCES